MTLRRGGHLCVKCAREHITVARFGAICLTALALDCKREVLFDSTGAGLRARILENEKKRFVFFYWTFVSWDYGINDGRSIAVTQKAMTRDLKVHLCRFAFSLWHRPV